MSTIKNYGCASGFMRTAYTLIGGNDLTIEHEAIKKYEFCPYVRINNHWLRQGGAIDLLVHECSEGTGYKEIIEKLIDAGREIGFLLNASQVAGCEAFNTFSDDSYFHNFIYYFDNHIYKKNPPSLATAWSNAFNKFYNFKPFTGFIALEWLRRNTANMIFVTGMTLYHEKINGQWVFQQDDKDRIGWRGPHEIEPHLKYLKDVMRTDARVIFDSSLTEIIKGT